MSTQETSATARAPDARDFSVVVTTFDDPWSLSCVLRAIAAQTFRPLEVVVADDGSTPATADALDKIAAELPFALVHVRQPHEGFRAARSRNNGIAAATCAYVAFLDQDTMPHPGWLAGHANALRPGRVSLGASLNMLPEHKQDLTPENIRQGNFVTWHTAADEKRLLRFHFKSCSYALCSRIGLGFRTRPVLRSGNFAIGRADILRVNGFDESFVGWGQEDDNLGRRLYLAGIKPTVSIQQARVTHIPHPLRHADRQSGSNMTKHKARITDFRSTQGLDARPYADVTIRRPGKT